MQVANNVAKHVDDEALLPSFTKQQIGDCQPIHPASAVSDARNTATCAHFGYLVKEIRSRLTRSAFKSLSCRGDSDQNRQKVARKF